MKLFIVYNNLYNIPHFSSNFKNISSKKIISGGKILDWQCWILHAMHLLLGHGIPTICMYIHVFNNFIIRDLLLVNVILGRLLPCCPHPDMNDIPCGSAVISLTKCDGDDLVIITTCGKTHLDVGTASIFNSGMVFQKYLVDST